jgi:hypothetical protein
VAIEKVGKVKLNIDRKIQKNKLYRESRYQTIVNIFDKDLQDDFVDHGLALFRFENFFPRSRIVVGHEAAVDRLADFGNAGVLKLNKKKIVYS